MKQVPTGFKDGFLWGGAVAACQIEGAYENVMELIFITLTKVI